MASASKRLRRERRLRRELSIYHRYTRLESEQEVLQTFLKQLQAREFYARATLLGVLAQRGGEAEVTTGTMQQVIDNLKNLSWTQEQKQSDPNTMIIKMVEGEPDVKEQKTDGNGADARDDAEVVDVVAADDPRTIDEVVGVELPHEVNRFHDEGNPNHED